VAIMRDTSDATFSRVCSGTGLWKMRMRESMRLAARKSLGNSLYDRLRGSLLRQT
jgi:hypothetical protein